ncbi:MAG TPA: hypothetical protein VFK09_09655 [Gemmatimonadales bacterium]|nr:hypothetical protein [Gemmatimonadales bacterium]
MPFTARDGITWIAYVEAVPMDPPRRWQRRTVLPPRRLRFDSATRSRANPLVPAGSPFLQEGRLRQLLETAEPVIAPPPGGRRWDDPPARRPAVALAAGALGAARTAAAWGARVGRVAAREAAVEGARLATAAFERVQGVLDAVVSRAGRARP